MKITLLSHMFSAFKLAYYVDSLIWSEEIHIFIKLSFLYEVMHYGRGVKRFGVLFLVSVLYVLH